MAPIADQRTNVTINFTTPEAFEGGSAVHVRLPSGYFFDTTSTDPPPQLILSEPRHSVPLSATQCHSVPLSATH